MMSAVITGLGVAAPNGLGVDAYWQATLRGDSGIGRLRRFDPSSYPVQLAGEIGNFDAREHLEARLLPQTDPVTRLSLAAADWAFEDAAMAPTATDEFDIGVVTASSSGGFEFGQRELSNLWSKGGNYVSAYQSFAWFYAVNTGQISIRHGLRGPSGVLVTDQAGGLDAIGQARRNIRRGCSVVVSGAVDSSLCPWSWVAHLTSGDLSTEPDPHRAYVPFDAQASGYVPGEGGAIVIVEDEAVARGRGARIYGEITGYAATFGPSALGAAIVGALRDADLSTNDIDVVFADASGVPERDLAEATTLCEIFGPYGVPVTAPKTMTGRLHAGGASLDVAAALLAIRDGVIPPTTNIATLAPGCEIDLVTGAPRPAPIRAALVVARGRGGFNSAMVVTAVSP